MYQKLLWIVALACSLVLSQATFAFSGGCGEGMSKMINTLKLDDAQKDKVKPILEQFKANMKDYRTQLGDIKKQLNAQLYSATMDQAAVDGLVDQKVALIGKMIKAKMAAKSQISAILNAEQKTKLQNKMKKMEEKMDAKYQSCDEQD